MNQYCTLYLFNPQEKMDIAMDIFYCLKCVILGKKNPQDAKGTTRRKSDHSSVVQGRLPEKITSKPSH